MCHCGAVVREFLELRADKPGSTPGDAAFCFISCFFFFILTADPAGNALGSIYISF